MSAGIGSLEVVCASAEATQAVAAALGRACEAGTIVTLEGDLGAGKTTFVQGLALGLGVPPGVRVRSPTFAIAHRHPEGRLPLDHADLYRVDDADELTELGVAETLASPEGVAAVEWASRCPQLLSPDRLELTLVIDGDLRRLAARATGPLAQRVLEAWRAALVG